MVTTMLIFLKTVGFVQSIVLALPTLCFPNIAKSDYKRLSICLCVCLSILTAQFVACWEDVHEI